MWLELYQRTVKINNTHIIYRKSLGQFFEKISRNNKKESKLISIWPIYVKFHHNRYEIVELLALINTYIHTNVSYLFVHKERQERKCQLKKKLLLKIFPIPTFLLPS